MASNQSTRSPIVESAFRTNAKGTAQLAEVLVFVDDQEESPSVLEFAALVAADNGARLKSLRGASSGLHRSRNIRPRCVNGRSDQKPRITSEECRGTLAIAV